MPDEQSAAAIRGLSREQKMGFIFLLVFAIVGLVLGVLQIRNTIFGPFSLTNTIPSDVKEGINDVDSLRFRDTDNDGLSDFSERYEYETSPYLYDSFSYGMSDKEVIEKGLPRCANAGKNCSNESTPLVLQTSTPVNLTPDESAKIDMSALINSPEQVRELLIQSGIDKKLLDQVNDADLMVMVQQLMTSSTFSSSTN